MKHTLGPWQVQITGGEVECVSGAESGLWAVVQGPDYDTRAANARLIAAAPELAQILDRILRAHESGNNGAVSGEAKLCVQFVELARGVLKEAGIRS